MITNIFSKNIKYLRKDRKFTMQSLANKLGYSSKSTIKSWENGESYPSIEKLIELVKVFEVSIDYLLRVDIKQGDENFVKKMKNL